MKTVSNFEKWMEGYVLACQIQNDRNSRLLKGVMNAHDDCMKIISDGERKHYTDCEILHKLYLDCSRIYSEYSSLLWYGYELKGYYAYYADAVNYFESEVDEW